MDARNSNVVSIDLCFWAILAHDPRLIRENISFGISEKKRQDLVNEVLSRLGK